MKQLSSQAHTLLTPVSHGCSGGTEPEVDSNVCRTSRGWLQKKTGFEWLDVNWQRKGGHPRKYRNVSKSAGWKRPPKSRGASKRMFLCLFSCVWLLVTPWTVACQAPLSMEFFRQEYWSGLPFHSPISKGMPPSTVKWIQGCEVGMRALGSQIFTADWLVLWSFPHPHSLYHVGLRGRFLPFWSSVKSPFFCSPLA